MKKKHNKLQEVFDNLDHPDKMNLVLYGKLEEDIKNAIEGYMVKELYCHVNILSKFKKIISNEYINFPIIEINKIENNDIGDDLLKKYDGIIGRLYY